MNDYASEQQVYTGEWSAHDPQILSSNTDLFLFLLNNPHGLTDEAQLREQVELLATGNNLSPEEKRKKSTLLKDWSAEIAEIVSKHHKLEENDTLALQQILCGATQASLLEKDLPYSAIIIQKDPTKNEDTAYQWNDEPQDIIHASFPLWFALTRVFDQRSTFNGIHIFRSQTLLLKRSAVLQIPGKEYILHLQPIHLVTQQLFLHQLRE